VPREREKLCRVRTRNALDVRNTPGRIRDAHEGLLRAPAVLSLPVAEFRFPDLTRALDTFSPHKRFSRLHLCSPILSPRVNPSLQILFKRGIRRARTKFYKKIHSGSESRSSGQACLPRAPSPERVSFSLSLSFSSLCAALRSLANSKNSARTCTRHAGNPFGPAWIKERKGGEEEASDGILIYGVSRSVAAQTRVRILLQ